MATTRTDRGQWSKQVLLAFKLLKERFPLQHQGRFEELRVLRMGDSEKSEENKEEVRS